MPPKIKRELKQDAIMMDAQGVKQSDIAQTLGFSVRTVQRTKQKLKKTGDIEGGVKKRGPKKIMDAGMELVCPLFSNIITNNYIGTAQDGF
jgi:transposase